jgi:Protein of unknown function (DUF4239)
MWITITVGVILLAAAAALVYNRRVWRPGQDAGRLLSDGLQIKEIAGPLASLAVLLLAFVLVQSFSSWSAAGRAEASEATATLLLFREADLVENPRSRQDVRRQVVCYATSVIEQEWPAMRDSKISNVPTYWATSIRRAAVRLVRSGADENAGTAMITRDGERVAARQDRLAEAGTSVPTIMYALLLLAVAVALVVVGIVTAKGVSAGVHAMVVLAATVVFASTLLMIRDLDQPYDGITGRNPTQTMFVRAQMQQDVVAELLPCDDRGMPKDAPLFRPQVEELS